MGTIQTSERLTSLTEQTIRQEARTNIFGTVVFLSLFLLGIAFLVISPVPFAWFKKQVPDPTLVLPFLLLGGVFALLIPLMSISAIMTGIRWQADPMSHPSLTQWARLGTPRDIASLLDAEMRQPETHTTLHGVAFSLTWLFRGGILSAIPHSEIAWVYKKVTRHFHGIIPTGMAYEVVIRLRSGSIRAVHLGGILAQGEKHADELLQEIQRRAPWAVFGFDATREQKWTTNRSGVVAQVDARQDKILKANRKE